MPEPTPHADLAHARSVLERMTQRPWEDWGSDLGLHFWEHDLGVGDQQTGEFVRVASFPCDTRKDAEHFSGSVACEQARRDLDGTCFVVNSALGWLNELVALRQRVATLEEQRDEAVEALDKLGDLLADSEEILVNQTPAVAVINEISENLSPHQGG